MENYHATKAAPKVTEREARIIRALLPGSWVFREEVDSIAGASNSPQNIAMIRKKFTGYDGLDTRKIDATDRDGKPCKPGQYRLNEVGRSRLQGLGLA